MAAGNSKKSAPGRPFQPGQSGNPSGRPKGSAGLPARIRELTNDGEDVVQYFVDVFKGEHELSEKHRHDAATWLADRLWGKAVASMELSGPDGGALTVEVVDRILKAAEGSE